MHVSAYDHRRIIIVFAYDRRRRRRNEEKVAYRQLQTIRIFTGCRSHWRLNSQAAAAPAKVARRRRRRRRRFRRVSRQVALAVFMLLPLEQSNAPVWPTRILTLIFARRRPVTFVHWSASGRISLFARRERRREPLVCRRSCTSRRCRRCRRHARAIRCSRMRRAKATKLRFARTKI